MADYTDEEKTEIAKWESQFRKLKTARIGYAVSKRMHDYTGKLYAKERQIEDEEHTKRLKTLPNGTRILVKFGSMANKQGIIYGHGSKYLYVQLDSGEKYKFPGRYLTDKIEDKMEKMTAETNQQFQPLARLMNDYLKGADQDG